MKYKLNEKYEMTFEEIAKELDITVKTAQDYFARAMRKIRRKLRDEKVI